MFKNNLINLKKTLWITYITGMRSIIEMDLQMQLNCHKSSTIRYINIKQV